MNGFIPGSRASFMLDLVVVAMVLVIPIIAIAIRNAKQGAYGRHKSIMLTLSLVLLIALVAFELEMRLLGWRHLAESSPYLESLDTMLIFHLTCSVSATICLGLTVYLALKNFLSPPAPNRHSQLHRRLGKCTAVGLTLTSITGWIFYWMAFVAA